MEVCQPTLLIDEVDTFMRENLELHGVINRGHTRDSAYVIRTVARRIHPFALLELVERHGTTIH
ncbi:MAG: hypothetical protein ABIS45_14555 [Burkholderiales bacterium]